VSRTGRIFAANMKKLRAAHGYTLRQVADHVGVAFSNVRRWESLDEKQFGFPTHENIDKIADLYRIAIADLFTPNGAAAKSMELRSSEEDAIMIFERLLREGKIGFRKIKKGEAP
jgi:transcriptional regulator with XRE-family HTH domain